MEKSHASFKPIKDLILFASFFSKNYLYLEKGAYYSEAKKYCIIYNTNKLLGAPEKNFLRIDNRTNKIQMSFDYRENSEINSDFIFLMIIWSGAFLHYKNTSAVNYKAAAKDTVLYFLTTKRNFNNARKGLLFVLQKLCDSDFCRDILTTFFDTYESEKVKEEKTLCDYTIDRENKAVTLYPMHLKYKSYNSYLNKSFDLKGINLSDIKGQIARKMREIYLKKDYQIFFAKNSESEKYRINVQFNLPLGE